MLDSLYTRTGRIELGLDENVSVRASSSLLTPITHPHGVELGLCDIHPKELNITKANPKIRVSENDSL